MAIETLLTEDEKIEEQEQFGIKPAHLEVTALSTGGQSFWRRRMMPLSSYRR
jgi:hypothetical protein